MRIQCPRCGEWTNEDAETCQSCGADLKQFIQNFKAGGSSKQTADEAVKDYLDERRKVRIRSTVKFVVRLISFVCIIISAFGVFYWGMPELWLFVGIALSALVFIETKYPSGKLS